MIVKTEQEIASLKKIGHIVALTIQEMRKHTRVGVTTRELDEIGARVLKEHGALSAPKVTYDFPGYTCISVNQEVAHGIPGDYVIQPGDLVNIDVSAQLDGYFADAGQSFQVEPHDPKLTQLCDDTYETMMKVISKLKHGVRLNEIGKTIQQEAKDRGYAVINNLCSHGIGKALHEYPQQILPYYEKGDKRTLKEGLVLTIEPFLSTEADFVLQQSDGWTLKVPDQSFVAQFEHTIIITKDEPIILTVV
ncbi:type I methionyl aminopeptidase [Paenibacillus agilis]|uniref:Methionine aminopeptidase n=1 Tax=Paenibacillus agilis TaxID=3020863 RepID=A0A559IZV5_9BACL|nr:type I methionyl aminopeptidase [Paenibacillus agilis]TVX93165.1 type I methionyl aminopeptidase [Paenibacillus agilis]